MEIAIIILLSLLLLASLGAIHWLNQARARAAGELAQAQSQVQAHGTRAALDEQQIRTLTASLATLKDQLTRDQAALEAARVAASEAQSLAAAARQRADSADRSAAEKDQQLRESLKSLEAANHAIAELKKLGALAEERHTIADRTLKSLDEQFKPVFQTLASQILTDSRTQFQAEAQKYFEIQKTQAGTQLDTHKTTVEGLVKPLKEKLDQYEKLLQEVEKARNDAYGALRQQITSLGIDQVTLKNETSRLVTSLRRPEVRGRWGELTLRRAVELAGMVEHCDFIEQAHMPDAGHRPDMIVQLPNQRLIVVDAKTPMDAFLSSIEAQTPEEARQFKIRHAEQIAKRVKELGDKRYWASIKNITPEFVVLFIPGESFLYPAMEMNPQLIEDAFTQGILIATPTMLIGLLKTIAHGWREEQLAENARKISDEASELHGRLCIALEHLEKLGKQLETTIRTYNQFVGSLESRVLPTARKMEELGAHSEKQLPAKPMGIEMVVRQLDAPMPHKLPPPGEAR